MSKPLPLREIVKWVRRNKSVARAVMNAWLKDLPPLHGRVLDLGGGYDPSYMHVLQLDGARFYSMDMLVEARPSFAGTLEREFPVAPATIDTVLLFNTLEHVYDFQGVAAEMHRVIKPGGTALVFVPFMFNFHTHKASVYIDDYFRYTQSALSRIFTDAGFQDVRPTALGGYGLLLADLLNQAIPFMALRAINTWLLGLLQSLASRRRGYLVERYPLAYAVELRK